MVKARSLASFRNSNTSDRPGRRTNSTDRSGLVVDPRSGKTFTSSSSKGRALTRAGVSVRTAQAAAKEAIKVQEALKQIDALKGKFANIGRPDVVASLNTLKSNIQTSKSLKAAFQTQLVATEQKFSAEIARRQSLREQVKSREKVLADRSKLRANQEKARRQNIATEIKQERFGITSSTKDTAIARLIQKQRVAQRAEDTVAVTKFQKAIKVMKRVIIPTKLITDGLNKISKGKIKKFQETTKKRNALLVNKVKANVLDKLTKGRYTKQLTKDITKERKDFKGFQDTINKKVNTIAKSVVEIETNNFRPQVETLRLAASNKLLGSQNTIQSRITNGTITLEQGQKELTTQSNLINAKLATDIGAMSIILNKQIDVKIAKKIKDANIIAPLQSKLADDMIKANVGGVFGFSQYMANKDGKLKSLRVKLQNITDDLDAAKPKALKDFKAKKNEFKGIEQEINKLKPKIKQSQLSKMQKTKYSKMLNSMGIVSSILKDLNRVVLAGNVGRTTAVPELTGTTAAALRKPGRAALAAGIVAAGTLISTALPPAGAAILSQAGTVLFAGYTGFQGYRIVKAETPTQRRNVQGEVLADVAGAITGGLVGRSISSRFARGKLKDATFKGKVKTRSLRSNEVEVFRKGNLKVGKKTIPTTEKVLIKYSPKTKGVNARITTTYKIGKKTISRVATLKGKESIFKRFKGSKQVNVKEIVGTLKQVSKTGIFNKKISDFATQLDGKKFTTLSSGKQKAIIKGLIKNLQSNKLSSSFDITMARKVLPKQTIANLLKGTINKLKINIKNAPKSLKAGLIKNLKTANKLLAMNSKKAQLAIPKPGDAFKLKPKDFSKINRNLAGIESKLKTLQLSKSRILTRGSGKTSYNPIDLTQGTISNIFSGLENLFVAKIVPIPILPSLALTTSLGRGYVLNVARQALAARVNVGTLAPAGVDTTGLVNTGSVTAADTVSITASTVNFPVGTTTGISFPIGLAAAGIPFFGRPDQLYKAFKQGGSKLPIRERFFYTPDLYSILFNVKASASERRKLLQVGRIFTGLSTRKKVN